MSGMYVSKPGLWTTVQDKGRWGLQKYGISPGGAADIRSFQLANWLVGNEGSEPALELTLRGPQLVFQQDVWIAISGADMMPTIDGKPVPYYCPVFVPGGAELIFGPARSGCRTYLAVAGGFAVPRVLGGHGAYPAAGLTGLAGRAVIAGDTLTIAALPNRSSAMLRSLAVQMPSQLQTEVETEPKTFVAAKWSVRPSIRFDIPIKSPTDQCELVIRIVSGNAFDHLTAESQSRLLEQHFRVLPQSNRMGCRLQGLSLAFKEPQEQVSEPVAVGTIQLPRSGDPIALLADRQTTGGYPRIAHIISADLPSLAQAAPGNRIRFKKVSIEVAQQIYRDQQKELHQMERFIRLKYEIDSSDKH